MNYAQCQLTEDGNLLIPDSVQVIPVKNSKVDMSSTIIEHMTDYTSSDSTSINAKVSVFMVHASFSFDYQKSKEKVTKQKSMISRSQLRYHLYTATAAPDIQLDPGFKDRLMDIAHNLQNNETKTAMYNAQRLVADYGTHFISRVDIGALVVQEDHVDSNYVKQMQEKHMDIEATAGGTFGANLGIDISAKHSSSEKQVDEYQKNVKESKVVLYGGPPYRDNFTLHAWVDQLPNNLVVIDRDGELLSSLVSPEHLPGVPLNIVQQTSYVVFKAITAYYDYNTYPGCTDMSSTNFDMGANKDDGTCIKPSNNFTFGGVYQICKGGTGGCRPQVNPQTGGYSCPPHFTSHLLYSGKVKINDRKCHKNFWGRKKCHDDWSPSYEYEVYWCAAVGSVPKDSGYLFGGFFTSKTQNMVTGAYTCPEKYTSIVVGGTLRVTICISDDYELGASNSIPFAGFFSCHGGNPLVQPAPKQVQQNHNGLQSLAAYAAKTASYPHRCPDKFSQHLLTIDNGCSVYYCTESGSIPQLKGKLPLIRRPPYGEAPEMYSELQGGVKVLFSTDDSRVWVKRAMQEDQGWKAEASQVVATEMQAAAELEDASEVVSGSSKGPSTTEIALSVAVGALGCAFVVTVLITVYRKKKQQSRYQQVQRPLLEPVEDAATYGSFDGDASHDEVNQA
jgi:hypothetical protein